MIVLGEKAPELEVSGWVGDPTTLAKLRGRVVALHAFQLLCPGCVLHGIPQALRMHEALGRDVAVLGLHSVFEHHEAMREVTLRAFLHEYRVRFPVAIDRHEPGVDTPVTMQAYGLRGTPSLILIGRDGRVRHHWFGRPNDLEVGLALGRLLAEEIPTLVAESTAPDKSASAGECGPDACALPSP